MASTSLIKNTLYKSLAEGVYKDVVTRSSSYYYFLGKTLPWTDENLPSSPVDSYSYERDVRNEIITLKEIKPSDVAFVVPRRDWIANVVYDMYDDKYCDEVIGIDIISGGSGYINVDDIEIIITGGGGTGATAVAVQAYKGGISEIVLTNPGTGYTSAPTVTVTSASGAGAVLQATMGIAASGVQKVEDADFYVVTDEYNVYKCLDNNNNVRSTYKPTGTQLDPFTLLDGYVWKFMYNIPINLRNKFYTDEYIPVVSALTSHFYSNGTIDNIFINNRGQGYTSALISVTGDGYRESDPIYINGAAVVAQGTGYITPLISFVGGGGSGASAIVTNVSATGEITEIKITSGGLGYSTTPEITISGGGGHGAVLTAYINNGSVNDIQITDAGTGYHVPTVDFTPPISTASAFVSNNAVNIGQTISTDYGDYYEVVTPGTMSAVPPSHKFGTVQNGTTALKYVGTKLKGTITTGSVKNIVSIEFNPGDNFTSAPSVYITDPTGVDATAQAKIPTLSLKTSNNGADGVVIENGGTGYVGPIAEVTGGGGSGARVIITDFTGGVITEAIVIDGGTGYTTTPTITITDQSGHGASLRAVLQGTSISEINVLTGGHGYSDPTVWIGSTGASEWTSTTYFNTGSFIRSQQSGGTYYYYIVTQGGTTSSSHPTHAEGTSENGTALLKYVEVSGGGGAGASATASVETGTITGVRLLGSVREVVVSDSGSGYIEPPEVIIGNAVDRIVLLDGGTGYTTTPTVTIEGGGGYGAAASAIVVDGTITGIILTDRGSGYTQTPLVVITGDGNSAQAEAKLVSGSYAVVKSKTYADKVISTYVVNPGDNYAEAPSVVFGRSYEQGLEVYTNQQYSFESNLYTIVQNGVFGSTPPTHATGTRISSPLWEPNTNIQYGGTVYVSNRLYKVVQAGLTSGTEPDHTSGIVENGTTLLQYLGQPASCRRAGSVATGYAVLRYGAGYSVTPTALIDDENGTGAEINFFTSKSEAKISSVVEDGQIMYLVVEDPGIGYTKASIDVSGNGSGAALIPDLSLGSISSQQANNEILTPSGTIDAIAIVSRGYSYGVANIIIDGDGTGATATAEIDPQTLALKKIHITNRGYGYSYADVKVVGNGQGAVLRAIISPYGGHGKNSPDELFSRSLMFYTNISTDLNQGVIIGNDYRQVGIIKNPRVFNGDEKFQGSIGSGCYIIQSQDIDVKFEKDSDIFIERVKTNGVEWSPSLIMVVGDYVWYDTRQYSVVKSGLGGSVAPTHTTGAEDNGAARLSYVGSTKAKKRYRIVSVTTKTVLVQSLDNDVPAETDTFVLTSNNNYKFVVVTSGLPSVDKYSGQLMYIDNKQGFTPSGDETITLRTIIRF